MVKVSKKKPGRRIGGLSGLIVSTFLVNPDVRSTRNDQLFKLFESSPLLIQYTFSSSSVPLSVASGFLTPPFKLTTFV